MKYFSNPIKYIFKNIEEYLRIQTKEENINGIKFSPIMSILY